VRGHLIIEILDLLIKDVETAEDSEYLYLCSVVASELQNAVNRGIRELEKRAREVGEEEDQD
jgi:hypothetical protein